jgi:hypothetical protein
MPLFDPSKFQISPQQLWANSHPWGGGHTLETDPTRQGWRLRARSSDLCIIGRKANGGGVRGCASVMTLSNGRLDVAIHDELTPKELEDKLKAGERVSGDEYFQVDDCWGWALCVLSKLHELHQSQ